MSIHSGLVTLLLSTLIAYPAYACNKPLRVGWDDWPPYHFRSDRGEIQGFAVEVLQSVLTELGCSVDFRERPWKRQLQELQSGEADIAMEAYHNAEREKIAYFSDSYSPSMANLWLPKDAKVTANSIGTLLDNGFILGVTKDFYYGPEVQKRLSDKHIQPVLSEQTNYNKLQKKRIDGFLGDWLATTWSLKQRGLEKEIVRSPIPIYSAPAFFMLSRKNLSPDFVSQFNRALAKLKHNGRYQQILDKYTKVE